MKKTLFIKTIFIFLTTWLSINVYSQQIAFPSAKGAGAYVTGGRGGQVIHVTNLNASGPGSLVEAIQTPGKRTIVFDVGGTIDITNDFTPYTDIIDGHQYDSITIAGQTAPGGITIQCQEFGFENVNNIIFRYLRIKHTQDPNQNYFRDIIEFRNCSDIIFDHVSALYGEDEGVSFIGNQAIDNITVQSSLIAEAKTGMIMGGAGYGNFSLIDNAWINISHRFPNTNGTTTGRFDIVNNVIYNWKYRWMTLWPDGPIQEVNFMNNYFKASDHGISQWGLSYLATNCNKIRRYDCDSTEIQVYTQGTVIEGLKNIGTVNDQEFWYNFNYTPDNYIGQVGPSYFTGVPFALSGHPYAIKSANQAFVDVMGDVGANAYLDATHSFVRYQEGSDSTILDSVLNDNVTRFGGEGYVAAMRHNNHFGFARPAGWDTDLDGMPDSWEMARYGNLSKDGTADTDADGYTDLEEYLNGSNNLVVASAIDVTPASMLMNVSDTLPLVVSFTPSNTTDQSGTWSTNNAGVATVSTFGSVIATGVGTTTIKFTTTDGLLVDSSVVTVTNSAIPATSVVVTPSNSTIEVHEFLPLNETVLPANATDKTGVWSSSNNAIATVTVNGVVKGISVGVATITFTTNDGSYTDYCTVNVDPSTQLYVESSAASIPNETNSIGNWTGQNAGVLSTQSQYGSYSISHSAVGDYSYCRYMGPALTNGVMYEVSLLVKSTNVSAYTTFSGGGSSYDNGINTSSRLHSSDYGTDHTDWQLHTWTVVANGSPLLVDICPQKNGSGVNQTIYLDEFSIRPLNTTSLVNVPKANDIKVYPNPASEEISIDINEPIKRITIIDTKGAEHVASFNNSIVNVSGLSNGMYILKIETDKTISHTSFVKN